MPLQFPAALFIIVIIDTKSEGHFGDAMNMLKFKICSSALLETE